MRIGIDLQVLGQGRRTGVGNYAFNLARALLDLNTKHEWVLFVPEEVSLRGPEGRSNPNGIAALASLARNDNVNIIKLPAKRIPFWSSHVAYANIMKRARLDVLHGVANVLPWFYSPLPSPPHQGEGSNPGYSSPHSGGGKVGGRSVITLHDLAIYKHPEWFPGGQWFSTKMLVPRSIKKSDAIIVPSGATKADLIELFGVAEEKIHVIAEGVEERFFGKNTPPREEGQGEVIENTETMTPSFSPPHEGEKDSSHHSHRYILFVGTLEPRKNVARLIEAYQALPQDIRAEYELVIAGGGEPPLHLPLSARGGQGEKERGGPIRFLGYVPDDQLPALYQGAALFVYPSLYEGFGLPVLEAMAAGVPVVASRQTAGNFQFLISNFQLASFDPYSVQQIRDAIARLIRDDAYSSEISKAGIEAARQYSWKRAAEETVKIYEGV
ncbi:glycosyltransferase family 1 protein [bacterium]|nr:MAG: glycosyltransferase family 1 protein [bacterium]